MAFRLLGLVLLIYALLVGGTYRGILLPDLRLFSLLLLTVVFVGWAVIRRRNRWRWHQTPLDTVLPLWILAFVLSLIFNLDASRRILLAMWYMGLYIGLWYIIHDIIANRVLTLQTLVDSILISGLVVVFLGYLELQQVVLASGLSLLQYRPRSIIGNPNTLGPFLLVVMLAIVSQFQATKLLLARAGFIFYLGLAGFLLFLTASRGTWMGLGGAIFVGGLLLANHEGLSPRSVYVWWQRQPTNRQRVYNGIAALLVIIGGLISIRVVQSITGSGRGDSGRLELYDAALNMFGENPLAGKGLFSFGRHIGRYVSLPPNNTFAHAHSLPLNLAGELGLVGLVAFGFSLYLLIRWLRRETSQTRYSVLGGVAIVGLGLTHVFDMPTITPSIALLGLSALILISQPQHALIVDTRKGRWIRNLAIGGLWAVLLLVGYWDTSLYTRYLNILWPGIDREQYTQTATALQTIADADPTLPVYPAQQAFFWGVAAANGDGEALQLAIRTYERVIAMEPYYAPFYANLGALYWESGQMQRGLTNMQHAASLANNSWAMHFNVGEYAEALGNREMAQAAYERALQAEPDADLHPIWADSPLRATLQSALDDHTPQAQIILLMESGQVDEAVERWESTLQVGPSSNFVLRSLLALAQNQRDEAQFWYEHAQQSAPDPLWQRLNEARLAQFDGDEAAAEDALSDIHQQITNSDDPFAADYLTGADIAFYHYFRQTTPAQFLPQVFYPHHNTIFLHLVNETETS